MLDFVGRYNCSPIVKKCQDIKMAKVKILLRPKKVNILPIQNIDETFGFRKWSSLGKAAQVG